MEFNDLNLQWVTYFQLGFLDRSDLDAFFEERKPDAPMRGAVVDATKRAKVVQMWKQHPNRTQQGKIEFILIITYNVPHS